MAFLLSSSCSRPFLTPARALLCTPASTLCLARPLMNVRSMSTTLATAAVPEVDRDYLLDEETVKAYNPKHYYPVRMGELFKNRYRTVGKLGFGSASTVWLCRDEHSPEDEYVALKVYINCSKVHRELPVYKHLNALKTEHTGQGCVRKMLDSFEHQGPHGTHICLVHEPFGQNFEQFQCLCPDRLFSPALIRELFRYILHGLDYLHEEAHIIHTDLQPGNSLMGVIDKEIFRKYEQKQIDQPVPQKTLDDRVVYASRPMPPTAGKPVISDLSEARFANSEHTDLIMPNLYRAPEVLLDVPWSYPVDKWAFAMVIWDLLEPNRVFNAKATDGYSETRHLAQMVAILGPPPLDFLKKSKRSHKYWNEEGEWIGKVEIPDTSLESLEQQLDGVEKKNFLQFMRKMLQWRPEDRSSWKDILMDEWLLADLIESGEVVVEED